MRYKYVVIEREYGSGGTGIGKLLSEKTGIPCYGSEILENVNAPKGHTKAKAAEFDKMCDNQIYCIADTPRIIFLTILRLCDTIF